MTMLAPHQRLTSRPAALMLAFSSSRTPTTLIHLAPNLRGRCAPRLRLRRRGVLAVDLQAGTTTAEYAIGTLAACAFAAVLYKILTGGTVAAALEGLIHRALGITG